MNLPSRRISLPGILALAAAAAVWCPARPLSAAPLPRGDASPIHNLRLANGDYLNASIEGYSLQSRVITLRLINGSTTYVAPRELTAMSKLIWLTSPAFQETLKTFRPTNHAIARVIERLVGPAAGVFLAGLLCFWLSAAFFGCQKKLLRATATYSKAIGQTVLIAVVTGAAMLAVSRALEDSPVLPMVHGILGFAGFIAAFFVVSFQTGSDYDISGAAGFGVVALAGGIGLTLATVTLYLIPRFLERPGLDDWFTDHLLAPLGLA